jgi:hypothetical protein
MAVSEELLSLHLGKLLMLARLIFSHLLWTSLLQSLSAVTFSGNAFDPSVSTSSFSTIEAHRSLNHFAHQPQTPLLPRVTGSFNPPAKTALFCP